ncbi:MAG: hypothetical protein ABI539_08360 [Acidobacteriota bacterium]
MISFDFILIGLGLLMTGGLCIGYPIGYLLGRHDASADIYARFDDLCDRAEFDRQQEPGS